MTEEEILQNNEMIAKFMGFPHKTDITEYNSWGDFKHSYDKATIYSNKKPKTRKHEEKFVSQVLAVHENFFELWEQEEDFECKHFLHYHKNWDDLMEVVDKIASLRLKVPNYNVVDWFMISSYGTTCLIESGLHSFGNVTSPFQYSITVHGKTRIEAWYRAICALIKCYYDYSWETYNVE